MGETEPNETRTSLRSGEATSNAAVPAVVQADDIAELEKVVSLAEKEHESVRGLEAKLSRTIIRIPAAPLIAIGAWPVLRNSWLAEATATEQAATIVTFVVAGMAFQLLLYLQVSRELKSRRIALSEMVEFARETLDRAAVLSPFATAVLRMRLRRLPIGKPFSFSRWKGS